MSSFLSSLFGYSDRPAQGSKLAYIPEELKPYVLEILKDTQELYKQRKKKFHHPKKLKEKLKNLHLKKLLHKKV